MFKNDQLTDPKLFAIFSNYPPTFMLPIIIVYTIILFYFFRTEKENPYHRSLVSPTCTFWDDLHFSSFSTSVGITLSSGILYGAYSFLISSIFLDISLFQLESIQFPILIQQPS